MGGFHSLQIVLFLLASLLSVNGLAAEKGTIQFRVGSVEAFQVPCRIHLRSSSGTPQKANGLPFWKDHFVCPGRATMDVPPGEYVWEIERGPEHDRVSGKTKIASGKKTVVNVKLARVAHLRGEGWYSGDLHVHRAASDIELLMSAEDLNLAPVIEWWNQPAPDANAIEQTEFRFADDRVYCLGAGEDEREGGALLYFGLKKPLDLSVKSREFPSPMLFVQEARKQNENVWIDIEKPFWWDVPTWIAIAKPDSVGIAHNHMHRSGVLGNEAWGRARDSKRYPGVKGNALWTQEIYYHILNSGIRIPPSAGSASGVLPNPVGYNRVYVQLDDKPFNRSNWFAALESGRCFVTNGPLLRVKANDEWPGHSFSIGDGLNVNLEIDLTSNDTIRELEVVHNGEIVKRIPCSDKVSQSLTAKLKLTEPGWFLVRAIADVGHTFRFASTAPWYIDDANGQPRISAASAQFFLNWVDERIERVNKNVPELNEREPVLRWHIEAREFWLKRIETANADLPATRNESWRDTKKRLSLALREFEGRRAIDVQSKLSSVTGKQDLLDALEPLVWLTVSINPESRVKIQAQRPKIRLEENVSKRFLVQIQNIAGITAPLNLSPFDLASEPPAEAKWCTIKVVNDGNSSRFLSGAETEFKVVEIQPHTTGLREVRIVGDAGQGTQDLGFRATADLLLDVQSTGSTNE